MVEKTRQSRKWEQYVQSTVIISTGEESDYGHQIWLECKVQTAGGEEHGEVGSYLM